MGQIRAVFIEWVLSSVSVVVVLSAADEAAKNALFTGTEGDFRAHADLALNIPSEAKSAIEACFKACAGKPVGFVVKEYFTLAAETPVSPEVSVVCIHPRRVDYGHRPRAQGNGSL